MMHVVTEQLQPSYLQFYTSVIVFRPFGLGHYIYKFSN